MTSTQSHEKKLHTLNTSQALLRIIFVLFCYDFVHVCLLMPCDHTGKGLTSWLLIVMSNCDVITFPLVSLVSVWCLIVSIPDFCPLSYF